MPDRPRQNPDLEPSRQTLDQPTPAGILTRPDESAPGDSAVGGDIPFSREELERWYIHELLSLQRIADRAAARLGVPVSRAKVREWLLALGIPRRSFSAAARLRARRKQAVPEDIGAGPGTDQAGQLRLFEANEEPRGR